ncbi:WD40 repeat domain-containing protein [Sodalinema gerasimenkoae]|uniref:WD40 repeat domain-containing protein n=1 Tax=Sodalinema gerasimenkoae TaxID=2862348 RepID=UPI00135C528A|nr:WD40 repeat domain-containing protein [Sodalinema gerasimenkoae]
MNTNSNTTFEGSKKLNVKFIQGESGLNFNPKDVNGRIPFRICVENRSGSYLAFSARVQLNEGFENNHSWYQVNPTVSKISHESETYFEIEIIDYPMRGVRGKVPISIEVFSEEDETIRASLKTTIDIQSFESLGFDILSLDNKIRVDAGQTCKIPIRLHNYFRRNDIEVKFQFKTFGKPLSDWLSQDNPNQNKTRVSWIISDEESLEKELFEITVPPISDESAHTNSRYPFAIEMTYKDAEKGQSEFTQQEWGTLIIKPTGELKLKCRTPVQELPSPQGHNPAKRKHSESDGTTQDSSDNRVSQASEGEPGQMLDSQTVFYEMSVKNASNLPQTVQLRLDWTDEQLEEAQERKVKLTFIPQAQNQSDEGKSDGMTSEPIELAPGGEETLYLGLCYEQKLRAGTLNFDVVAENVSEGEKRPWETSRLTLTLQVSVPSLSLWGPLFFLMVFLFLLAGSPWVRYWLRGQHQYPMTAVALQGTGRVWTGAGGWQDGEGGEGGQVFGWDINRIRPMNLVRGWEGTLLTPHQLPKSSQVRVIRPGLSESASGFMAVGLSNGDIYTFPRNQPDSLTRLTPKPSEDNSPTDNLFDLAWYSEDVLFSAHGSGEIQRWDVDQPGNSRESYTIDPAQPIYSLANVRGHDADSRWLLFGSERNQFGIWMWRDDPQKVIMMTLPSRQERTASEFLPIHGRQDFLSSFAVAPNDNRLLMIGDTTGSVRLLDLHKLRECFQPIAGQSRASLRYPALDRRFQSGQEQNTRWHWRESDIPEPFCSNDLIAYENREQHGGAAVRSVAIAKHDGCHYGASVGDDGTVALWLFRDQDVETGSLAPNPTRLGSVSRTGIGSVDIDIDADRNQVLIAVASDNRRVQIYRRGLRDDSNCQ